MPLILGTNSIKDTGYDVDNSLRFNSGSSDYLNYSTGNSTTSSTKATLSAWVKRTSVGVNTCIFGHYQSNSLRSAIYINDDDDFLYFQNGTNIFLTNAKFRDASAWYHFVITIDLTQGTASNRVKVYVNGVQETSFATENYPSQNASDSIPNFGQQTVGANIYNSSPDLYFNGYMAEVCFIDGQALAPTSFGEFDEDSGIWKPINVSGLTFGTNGFYLDFEDSSALGNDVAGSNNFTVNNLTAIDQSTDTCTNNFSTYNPLMVTQSATIPAFSEGNLKSTFNNAGLSLFALSTFAVSSGKWFAEFKMTNISGGSDTYVGVVKDDANFSAESSPIANGTSYRGNGQRVISGSSASYGATYSTGDIIGLALNCDDNEVVFYKNGASQGAVSITADTNYFMWTSDYNSKVIEANFGSPPYTISSGNSDGNGYGNFEYAVPSGYYALNTKNLAEFG